MDMTTPVQSSTALNRARLRPTPVEKVPEKEARQEQVLPVESRLPTPAPAPESLEGRDLADPFQARRTQEQAATAPREELAAPEMEVAVLAPATANDAAAEVATTAFNPEPDQAATTPRSIARYQDVPRARADQMAATGGLETEPEPFAMDARDGMAEAGQSSNVERAELEQTNEDNVRRGSAAVSGAALSAAGEQLATTIDDRSLRAQSTPEPTTEAAGPDDGLESPEATNFEAPLPGTTDVQPGSLVREQDPSIR